ncbi:uncharacterized protein CANTADRAFT_26777 [Suhomyces tanzawaensis NRRL Y-17324]|uniref:Uncharacterized protein n=1 Tax=Suhomyces tanzawaensis NRRL Y-17324 TaxID=984487 RepID=A0A1E4SH74_9ASCO|nr:uncharacterized protein CANTADRAFT_26777 [Suhomyces tanzawaensis NRRL Y-17324]ODV78861.1 hypothetical protein CANTADRAFT_26777 [Suhomyces tanzawaensis NRRL Y-17324]
MKLSNFLVSSSAFALTYAASPSIWFTGDNRISGQIIKQTQKWNIPGDKVTGYYYGTQFFFSGTNEIGYYGPQPRPEGTTNHLAFSVFGYGPYSDHPNCSKSADGGPGVSCAIDFPWEYGKNYTTEVARTAQNDTDGSNRWTGTLIDDETGQRVVIGEYWTPQNYSLLTTGGNTFDELYTWEPTESKPCIPQNTYIGFYPVYHLTDGSTFTASIDNFANLNVLGDACARAANESNQQAYTIPGGFVFSNGVLNVEYEGHVKPL